MILKALCKEREDCFETPREMAAALATGIVGDLPTAPAWEFLRRALSESMAIGVTPLTLDALVGVVRLRAETGEGNSAAVLLGVALNHPAVEIDSVKTGETVLAGLRTALSTEQVEIAMERGKTLELDAVVAELLAD